MADILSPKLVKAAGSPLTKVGLHWLFRVRNNAKKDPGVDYFSTHFPLGVVPFSH